MDTMLCIFVVFLVPESLGADETCDTCTNTDGYYCNYIHHTNCCCISCNTVSSTHSCKQLGIPLIGKENCVSKCFPPSPAPTLEPTPGPTKLPTLNPIKRPTIDPTVSTVMPTLSPSDAPTTDYPTISPTIKPSISPIINDIHGASTKSPTGSLNSDLYLYITYECLLCNIDAEYVSSNSNEFVDAFNNIRPMCINDDTVKCHYTRFQNITSTELNSNCGYIYFNIENVGNTLNSQLIMDVEHMHSDATNDVELYQQKILEISHKNTINVLDFRVDEYDSNYNISIESENAGFVVGTGKYSTKKLKIIMIAIAVILCLGSIAGFIVYQKITPHVHEFESIPLNEFGDGEESHESGIGIVVPNANLSQSNSSDLDISSCEGD